MKTDVSMEGTNDQYANSMTLCLDDGTRRGGKMSFDIVKKRSRIFVITLVVLGLVWSGCAPGASPTPEKVKPIKIGLAGPYSGEFAIDGDDLRTGAGLVVDEINAAGGLLGRPIELFTADNECSSEKGVSAVRKLIDIDEVDAIIGGVCSSATLASMPVIAEEEVPQLTVTATSPKITEQAGVGGNEWQFRLNIDDSIQAKVLSAIIAEDFKSAVIFAPNDDWGRSAVEVFTKELTSVGVTVLDALYFEYLQPDFRPLLTKAKDHNPEAILAVIAIPDASTFMKQFRELGMTQQVFARGTMVTDEFLRLTEYDCSIGEGAMESNQWSPTGAPMEEEYQAKYGRRPRTSAALAYFGMKAIVEAIQLMGKADRESIRDGLEQVSFDDPGIGHIEFDDHHQAHHDLFISQFRDCEVVIVARRPTAP